VEVYRTPDERFQGLPGFPFEPHYLEQDGHVNLVTRLDLSEVTVVMQDWGGPIGMRLAAERSDRVSRLVVLNTGIFSGRPPSEGWLRFRAFVRRVGTDLRPGQLVRITCPRPIDDEVVAGYDAPHPVPESKSGIVMFPELVPDAPDHPSAATMLKVREAMKRWTKPALVLFGDCDPVFAPRAAHAMAARIPGAGPAEFAPGAGHFLQEDDGEAVARRVVAFLDEAR
jgi:haloalkane dehalogenase